MDQLTRPSSDWFSEGEVMPRNYHQVRVSSTVALGVRFGSHQLENLEWSVASGGWWVAARGSG